MSSSETWMPFYVGDYLAATQRLTTEQHGAYMLILMDSWSNGPPPADDRVLALIARMTLAEWKRTRPALAGFFSIIEGAWVQRRLERERTRANEIIEKRRQAGLASAEARKRQHNGQQKPNKPPTHVGTPVPANAQQTGRPSQSQEEEGSDANASGGKPPADDPIKAVFDLGVSVLTAAGSDEKQARSLVGKWRRDYGDSRTSEALLAAKDKTEPVAWIIARLNGQDEKTNEHWEAIERKFGGGQRLVAHTTGET